MMAKKIGKVVVGIVGVLLIAGFALNHFRNQGPIVDVMNEFTLPEFGSQSLTEVMKAFDPNGSWSSDPETYGEYEDSGYAVLTYQGTCDVVDETGSARNAVFFIDFTMTPQGDDGHYIEVADISIDGWTYNGTSPYVSTVLDVIYGNEYSTDLLVSDDSNWLGLGTITFAQKDKLTTNWIAEADGLDPGANASEPSDEYIEDYETAIDAFGEENVNPDADVILPAWLENYYVPYDLGVTDTTRYYTFSAEYDIKTGVDEFTDFTSICEIAITQMDCDTYNYFHVTMREQTGDGDVWTVADDSYAYFEESTNRLVFTTDSGYMYYLNFDVCPDTLDAPFVSQYTMHGVDDTDWQDPYWIFRSETFYETTTPTLF